MVNYSTPYIEMLTWQPRIDDSYSFFFPRSLALEKRKAN